MYGKLFHFSTFLMKVVPVIGRMQKSCLDLTDIKMSLFISLFKLKIENIQVSKCAMRFD